MKLCKKHLLNYTGIAPLERRANLEKDVAMDKEDLNLKRVFLEVQLR